MTLGDIIAHCGRRPHDPAILYEMEDGRPVRIQLCSAELQEDEYMVALGHNDIVDTWFGPEANNEDGSLNEDMEVSQDAVDGFFDGLADAAMQWDEDHPEEGAR